MQPAAAEVPAPPAQDEAASEAPLDPRRRLAQELGVLELELDDLHKSLGPLTMDAYRAAFDRNDFVEFDSAPTRDAIDGKLVSVRRPNDGPYQLVTLPRSEFPEAYRVYDLVQEKMKAISEKQEALRKLPAVAPVR